MTCRHDKNDSSCSSHRNYVDPDPPRKEVERSFGALGFTPTTPDASNYEIMAVSRVGKHLVMKVKYPNCRSCAYEGSKIMVFTNVTEMQALRWRKIDPHFRDPKSLLGATEAPAPAARFPGSDNGWLDAIEYATRKA